MEPCGSQQLKGITLQANESLVSYDVSVLFTSVLIDPAINIIRRKLELGQETPSKNTNESRADYQPTGSFA